MDYQKYFDFHDPDEKPLDRISVHGGLTPILRSIGCIGDSLSSGEFESLDEAGNKGYHDRFEYSWGQFMARDCGILVRNFSRGGMTASEYMQSFGDASGFWDPEKSCNAYILALGVNDILNQHQDVGSISDVDLSDWRKNRPTFAGYYAGIVQRLLGIQPKARFFFMTMPRDENGSRSPEHTALLHDLAELFPFSYVIDLDAYAPVYDSVFRNHFFLGGHLNAAGYLFTARMVESYIDYIIRHNPDDFTQIGFVGTGFHNVDYRW